MNAEAILVKIEEDAKLSAERILSDAQARAEAMKHASRKKIEDMHKATVSKAAEDSAELEQRMLRMAGLDERKLLLARKRDLIEEAFTIAREQVGGAPAAQKRQFFLAQLLKNAAGNETVVVGETRADWFDSSFIEDANRALATAGKNGGLTLAQERAAGCEGVVLKARGAETHCTFEAILTELRPQLELSVAAMLFDER